MIREYTVKTASLLLLVGLIIGLAGQVELLKPGISFMSPELWGQILPLHVWVTVISLMVICLSTISLIRDKTTLGQWAIWFGLATIPLLYGGVISLMLLNVGGPDSYLSDSYFMTANRHAFGTAVLLVALGGLSALQRVKFKSVPLKVSFGFALLITGSGVAAASLQATLGLNGLPRRYIDYPAEFAPLHFFSGIAAIFCVFVSAIYVILLWRHRDEKLSMGEGVF